MSIAKEQESTRGAVKPVGAFPMTREARCPFDPPPTGRAAQEAGALTRVELSDGTTPWFITRYAEQRSLLSDPRLSADSTRPGYPVPGSSYSNDTGGSGAEGASSGFSFILMDDPEHARLRRMVTAPFMVNASKPCGPEYKRSSMT